MRCIWLKLNAVDEGMVEGSLADIIRQALDLLLPTCSRSHVDAGVEPAKLVVSLFDVLALNVCIDTVSRFAKRARNDADYNP